MTETTSASDPRPIELDLDDVRLPADLGVPEQADGLVVFAHGSGSSRKSPRNRGVASTLREAGLATLLFDLLTEQEALDRRNVFDIGLLGRRLLAATAAVRDQEDVDGLALGLFGSSTGAAAALDAAAAEPGEVAAVVSRGGRVDMANDPAGVTAPVRMIVGGDDTQVLELNRQSSQQLGGICDLQVIEGAGHLFEGPGELEQVAELARDWFLSQLT